MVERIKELKRDNTINANLVVGENIQCIHKHDIFTKDSNYTINDLIPFDDNNTLIMIKADTTSNVYVFSYNEDKNYEQFEKYFITKKELLNKKLKKLKHTTA